MRRINGIAIALLLAASAAQAAPVWRCPGPPVVYRDDITPEKAAALSCREIEGVPKPATRTAPKPKPNPDGPKTLFEMHDVPDVPEPPMKEKRHLGALDQWRYDSCREKASQAPTATGVKTGMELCNEKFGQ